MSKYLIALLIVVTFLLGFFVGIKYAETKVKSSIESSLILEKIKDVFKIATVEANINEIYQHKDFTWFDLSPFRKTAMIRLQATVLAGIDLDSSGIDISEKNKIIRISYDPNPRILSIDHKLDYFDLQQGTFNYFSPEELTLMQADAKKTVSEKALQTGVLLRATQRKDELFASLQQICAEFGWTLVLDPKPIQKSNLMK